MVIILSWTLSLSAPLPGKIDTPFTQMTGDDIPLVQTRPVIPRLI